jgi:hypothetical protein
MNWFVDKIRIIQTRTQTNTPSTYICCIVSVHLSYVSGNEKLGKAHKYFLSFSVLVWPLHFLYGNATEKQKYTVGGGGWEADNRLEYGENFNRSYWNNMYKGYGDFYSVSSCKKVGSALYDIVFVLILVE